MTIVRTAVVFLALAAISAARMEAQQARSRAAWQSAPASMQAVGSVKDIMEAMTIPTSDAVFKAASEPPASDAEWLAVRRQALALAESANLLLMPPRALDRAEWTRFTIAQRDAAVLAMRASDSKNADALSNASDVLYETCSNCHKKYMPSR